MCESSNRTYWIVLRAQELSKFADQLEILILIESLKIIPMLCIFKCEEVGKNGASVFGLILGSYNPHKAQKLIYFASLAIDKHNSPCTMLTQGQDSEMIWDFRIRSEEQLSLWELIR